MVELLATGIVHAAAAVPLLQNEGFLQDPVQPAQPRAWRTFQHEGVYEIGVDVSQPGTHDGSSVRIFGVRHDGRNSRAGVGQVTPVQDGTYAVYELHLRYKGDIEQADYLVWVRPPQSFDDLHSFRGVLPTPRDTWTEVTVELRVPEPIRVNGFRFEVLLYGRGDGTVWYDSAQLVPKEGAESGGPPRLLQPSSKLEAQFSPHEGMIVQQNPPSFVWPGDPEATEYELLISPTPEFPPGETLRFADLNLNLHTPETPMGPGTWYWMVRGLRRGVTVSESAVRKFEIDEAATVFTLPSVESLLQRIPAHPRILVDQAVLSQFRSSVNLDLLRRGLRSQLASRIGEPLHPEPTFFGDQNSQDYVDFIVPLVNRPTMDLTARMRQMAHAYLLTGDEVYANEARRIALHLAQWDPEGATGYHNADQAFRDIALFLSVAYDWIYPVLSAEEKETILQAIAARASVLYHDFTVRRKLNERPYDSHAQTALGFLGVIALATLGDIDEAASWLAFVLPTYAAQFPPWGGQDGGWSQGVTYQKYSMHSGSWFWLSLKNAFGIDLFQKPWYRNAGYFKLYFHPPHDQRASFGSGYHEPPGPQDAWNMAYFASQTGNGYFKWYAEQVGYRYDLLDPLAFWWKPAFDAVQATPPVDIPQSVHFRDIGWVAMHASLADPDEVFLLFKSSPYGSFNHSHADQNSFVLSAFGEPLAIRSGVYDYYGSPHDTQWNRQTAAQNAILFGGQGQRIFDMSASGEIVGFFHGSAFDYAAGDATQAYGTNVEKARRHIIFFRPDYFVIFDDGRTRTPETTQWMLHAVNEMEIDEANNTVTIASHRARLAVHFVVPDNLGFRQTNAYPVEPIRDYTKEWHLTVEQPVKRREHRYMTVLVPYRAEQAYPVQSVRSLSTEHTLAAEIVFANGRRDYAGLNLNGTDDRAESGAMPAQRPLRQVGPVSIRGEAFAVRMESGKVTGAFLVNGTYLGIDGFGSVRTQNPATIEVVHGDDLIRLLVDTGEANELWFQCGPAARHAALDGGEGDYVDDGGTVQVRMPAGRRVLELGCAPGTKILEGWRE